MSRLSFTKARTQLAAQGIKLTVREGEYRVTFAVLGKSKRAEEVASYTDDLEDAVGTAEDMVKRGAPPPPPRRSYRIRVSPFALYA